MEVNCQYRECGKKFIYDETKAGRPPDFCCEKHKKAEMRARQKEKVGPVSRAVVMLRLWRYYKRHRLLLLNGESCQKCLTCGYSWVNRNAINFECPMRPIYTTLTDKPSYLVDGRFLEDHHLFPAEVTPIPCPAAFLLLESNESPIHFISLYDLREITPLWSELLEGEGE